MKQENKSLMIKYLICVGVACALAVAVFAIQGFFTDDVAVNMQVLADGFSISGALLLMCAGIMFISGEGALIGIGYALRYTLLTFIPGGRSRQEMYKDYRERKMEAIKKSTDQCVLFVGLAFLAIGLIFMAIWYLKYYNAPIA